MDAAGSKVFELTASVDGKNAHSYRVLRFPATVYPDTSAPANVSAARILGKAEAGRDLVCSSGEWNVVPAPEYAVRWFVDGLPAVGARGNTYRLKGVDVGRAVSCRLTATSGAGSATADAYLDTRPPAVRLRTRRLRMDLRRMIALPLRCPAHELEGCEVRVTVRTTKKFRGRLVAGRGVAPRRLALVHGKTLRIESAGQTRVLRARLSRRNAALLRKLGRTPVRVKVQATDAAGNMRTTRAGVFLVSPLGRRR